MRHRAGSTSSFFKPYSLRDVIKRRLEEQGVTPYQLAKHLTGVVPQRTLYNYLAGGEIKSRYLDAILYALFIGTHFAVLPGGHPKAWIKREWARQAAESVGLYPYYESALDQNSTTFKDAAKRKGELAARRGAARVDRPALPAPAAPSGDARPTAPDEGVGEPRAPRTTPDANSGESTA